MAFFCERLFLWRNDMPFDSEGNFTRVHNWDEDRQNDIDIASDRMDAEFDNYATALNNCALRDGRAPLTGDLDLGNFKIRNVASGGTDYDAVNRKQMNDGLNLKENLSNKVTEYSEEATDTQYPSAKLFYTKTKELKDNCVDIDVTNLTADGKKSIINAISPNFEDKQSVSSYPFNPTKAGWLFGGWDTRTSGAIYINGVKIGTIASDPDGTNSSAFTGFVSVGDSVTISGTAPHFCTFVACKGA